MIILTTFVRRFGVAIVFFAVLVCWRFDLCLVTVLTTTLWFVIFLDLSPFWLLPFWICRLVWLWLWLWLCHRTGTGSNASTVRHNCWSSGHLMTTVTDRSGDPSSKLGWRLMQPQVKGSHLSYTNRIRIGSVNGP